MDGASYIRDETGSSPEKARIDGKEKKGGKKRKTAISSPILSQKVAPPPSSSGAQKRNRTPKVSFEEVDGRKPSSLALAQKQRLEGFKVTDPTIKKNLISAKQARTRKRKKKEAQPAVIPSEEVEWVECEHCELWRKLPPDVSPESLPGEWYCGMAPLTSFVCGVEDPPEDEAVTTADDDLDIEVT